MMWNFGASPAPETKTEKHGGGNLQPPPPDKPKEWKAIGVLQYKDSGGVFEFRVISMANLAQALREELHDKHGISSISWEAK